MSVRIFVHLRVLLRELIFFQMRGYLNKYFRMRRDGYRVRLEPTPAKTGEFHTENYNLVKTIIRYKYSPNG